jgi:hypothetical protein
MNTNIESIELVFENCNTIKIPKPYINYFHIQGIKENLTYTNPYTMKLEKCEYCSIYLNREWCQRNNIKWAYDELSVLERITNNPYNICGICIYFENGEKRDIFLPWGQDEYINEFQVVEVTHDEVIIKTEEK